MGIGYGKDYYAEYDIGDGIAVDYLTDSRLRGALNCFAERIVNDLSPATVLDAGCAMGVFVAALRTRGVDAYGVDLSEYAIANAEETARPYCYQGSLADPLPEALPKRFDLVTCFEVLEHMPESEARRAIKSLCSVTDTILFCSTPDDAEDITHVDLQQRETWALWFAENGFYDDLCYRPRYITPYAVCYRRRSDWREQLAAYERYIRSEDVKTERIRERLEAAEGLSHKCRTTVYFDYGVGFSEEHSFVQTTLLPGAGAVALSVRIPEGCRQLRIDPCEGTPCAVTELSLIAAGTALPVYDTNGHRFDSTLLFRTGDPQIRIKTDGQTGCMLHVRMHITLLDSADTLPSQLIALVESHAAATAEVDCVRTELDTTIRKASDNAAKLEAQIAVSQTECARLAEVHAAQLKTFREEAQAERAQLAEELEKLREEAQAERTQHAEELEKLREEAQAERTQHAEELEKLRKESQAERTQHTEKLEALREEAQAERTQLAEDHAAQLAAQRAASGAELARVSEARDAARSESTGWFNRAVEITQLCDERLRIMRLQEADLHNTREQLSFHSEELRRTQEAYREILGSACWRATKPVRSTLDAVKRIVSRFPTLYRGLHTGKLLLGHGPAYVRRKRIEEQSPILLPADIRLAEEKTSFPRNIRFSILVPLYNTPMEFLQPMLYSVLAQTYPGWELCLADGSDPEHREVGEYCRRLARRDKRILYHKLERNGGISENTNACIEMSTGEYIALFDHDDILHPSALYAVMQAICEKDADFIYTDENTFHDVPADAFNPHYKPDFAPDTLRAGNYICHFTVFSRALLEPAGGGFRKEYDGSQDHDMVLRLTEQAKHIVHVPRILYYWRAHRGSVAESIGAKPYVVAAGKKAVADQLRRLGLEGEVLGRSMAQTLYRLKYRIKGEPLISIIIPNKDHVDDLRKCLESINERSTYRNFEIIIVENNSEEQQTFDYYRQISEKENIRVVTWKGSFNYSAINNFGFQYTRGEHILLLNNDTEIISPDWLQELLMYSQRSDIGAVGAKLLYADETIQHAGIGIGLLTLAGHYFRNVPRNHPGYMGRLFYAQEVSAVTAACMLLPRRVYEEMSGLDESFEVAFNDVDLCMRIRRAGYLIVWTPWAELYHYESKSRGLDDIPEKKARFDGEVQRFRERWSRELEAGDPYYNVNFSLDYEDFRIKGQ